MARILPFLLPCWMGCGTGLVPAEPPSSVSPSTSVFWDLPFRVIGQEGDLTWYETIPGADTQGFEVRARVQRQVSSEQGKVLVEEKRRRFASLYEPSNIGYPGQITRTATCADVYRASIGERPLPSGRFTWFRGWATANGAGGACSADVVARAHLHGWLLCDAGLLVEVDGYADPAASDQVSVGASAAGGSVPGLPPTLLVAASRLDALAERISCEGL